MLSGERVTKWVSSKTKIRNYVFTTGLVLSVLGLLLTGCAQRAVGTGLNQQPSPNRLTHADVTIKNTTMFELTYVVVLNVKGRPFSREKDWKYVGWLGKDAKLTIKNVPNGRYWLVYKVGYIDDVLYYEFLVLANDVTLVIRDINKKFEVGG